MPMDANIKWPYGHIRKVDLCELATIYSGIESLLCVTFTYVSCEWKSDLSFFYFIFLLLDVQTE